ncbi:MAG: FAD-binding protein [Anaerolineae bacterium]|nr:FAD-binding protein [Anaerolineae bacterium]
MSKLTWTNWSGGVQSWPEQIVTPGSLDEIIEVVKMAASTGSAHGAAQQKQIRLVAAGHSFTPVAQTDSIMMSLDNYQGIEAIDKEAGLVTVKAGTRLYQLGATLHENGLAQENLGDINQQSIAGAVSTGTHGTGADLQTIATQIVALKLINGRGELVTIDESEPDLLNAARISLGMLGIIVEVTLRVVPAYKLHLISQPANLDGILADLETHKQNRHFEFFWFPHTKTVQFKRMNPTKKEPTEDGFGTWLNDVVIENGALWLASTISKQIPSTTPAICRLSGRFLSKVEKVDYSYRVFAATRTVRFEEMEYNVPAASFTDCLHDIEAEIERQQFPVNFPVECRFVKADDIWLSPAYQRDSGYIAVHVFKGKPFRAYFEAIEAIFQKYNGRPHWGKRHTFTPAHVQDAYPKANDFLQLRTEFDPQGIFLNQHLRQTFGIGQSNQ